MKTLVRTSRLPPPSTPLARNFVPYARFLEIKYHFISKSGRVYKPREIQSQNEQDPTTNHLLISEMVPQQGAAQRSPPFGDHLASSSSVPLSGFARPANAKNKRNRAWRPLEPSDLESEQNDGNVTITLTNLVKAPIQHQKLKARNPSVSSAMVVRLLL